jgi:hypothetical protein
MQMGLAFFVLANSNGLFSGGIYQKCGEEKNGNAKSSLG